MKPVKNIDPRLPLNANDPDWSDCTWRLLAEGDSWFSIGTLNPAKNSNLLFEMEFSQWAGAVNCASPGDTLGRMCKMNCDPTFTDLLLGRRARIWDALLISCGGNDLIDAFGVGSNGVPPEKRLLLTQAEWGAPELGPARYLSDAGWQTFRNYMAANLDHLVALRDQGPSRGVPIFLHGYAYPTPRPSGAGLKLGPWLYPSALAYGVPEADYLPLATLLIGRFAELMGGTVGLDSAPGRGSLFWFTARLQRAGAPPLSASGSDASGFVAHTALLHADPGAHDLGELIAEVAERTRSGYVFGGLVGSRSAIGRIRQFPLKRALRDAKLKAHEVDGVLLVGGSTRMPSVRAAVAHGVLLYLLKPFTFAAFRDMMANTVGGDEMMPDSGHVSPLRLRSASSQAVRAWKSGTQPRPLPASELSACCVTTTSTSASSAAAGSGGASCVSRAA